MTHPSEGMLQAFIDGEVAADERARVAAHLDECAACTGQLWELRRAAALFSRAVAGIDVTPDLAGARAVTLRRGRPAPVIRLLGGQSARARELRRTFVRAAVLVLLVAGAASAAVPGSAVRRFFVNLWHQTTRLFGAHPAAPPPPARIRIAPAPAPAPVPPAGVSVLPEDGDVRIVVHDVAPGLRVHVRVLDTDRASVEADGAAASAHFRTAPGRIEVTGGGAGDLRVGIPRSALRASVALGGKPVFTRNAGQTHAVEPAQSGGGETVFRVR